MNFLSTPRRLFFPLVVDSGLFPLVQFAFGSAAAEFRILWCNNYGNVKRRKKLQLRNANEKKFLLQLGDEVTSEAPIRRERTKFPPII